MEYPPAHESLLYREPNVIGNAEDLEDEGLLSFERTDLRKDTTEAHSSELQLLPPATKQVGDALSLALETGDVG